MDRSEPRPDPSRTRDDGIRPERRSAAGAQPAADGARHQRRTSDVIRTCRESTGLDRASFAADVGVPEHILALWEDPTYEGVDLAILRRVARAAGGELELRFRSTRIRPGGCASSTRIRPGGCASKEGADPPPEGRRDSPNRESA